MALHGVGPCSPSVTCREAGGHRNFQHPGAKVLLVWAPPYKSHPDKDACFNHGRGEKCQAAGARRCKQKSEEVGRAQERREQDAEGCQDRPIAEGRPGTAGYQIVEKSRDPGRGDGQGHNGSDVPEGPKGPEEEERCAGGRHCGQSEDADE